jgi:hypothetical protein
MWKERLWQLFLVAILGLVLTMCSRSGGNDNSSSSGDAIAEGTTTVSVSSIPSLTVKSMPSMTITVDNTTATPIAVTSFPTLTLDNSSATPVSVTSIPVVTLDNSSTLTVNVANAGPNAISHTMICRGFAYSSGIYYMDCDASDDTVLSSGTITHDAAFAAGWKLVGPACGTGITADSHGCVLFHK